MDSTLPFFYLINLEWSTNKSKEKSAVGISGLTVRMELRSPKCSNIWGSEEKIEGYWKKKDDPTSFRRHAAFPSRQHLQAPCSPVVCPCRNVLGKVAANPFGSTVYLLPHYGSHSNSMDAAGLYLLHRSGWWISSLFRLVGDLFSAYIYLRFS